MADDPLRDAPASERWQYGPEEQWPPQESEPPSRAGEIARLDAEIAILEKELETDVDPGTDYFAYIAGFPLARRLDSLRAERAALTGQPVPVRPLVSPSPSFIVQP